MTDYRKPKMPGVRQDLTGAVAFTPQPSPAVYGFACNHSDASNVGISVMFEFTPAGGRIRRTATRH